jgi:hypothetical protein
MKPENRRGEEPERAAKNIESMLSDTSGAERELYDSLALMSDRATSLLGSDPAYDRRLKESWLQLVREQRDRVFVSPLAERTGADRGAL